MEQPPEQSADASGAPEAAHDARVEALQRLARRTDAHPPDQPTAPKTPASATNERPGAGRRISPRALAIGAVGVLVIVAVVATVLVRNLQSAATPTTRQKPTPHAIQIAPLADGLNCPVDIAWSPDNSHIALLGYQDHCPYKFNGSGVSVAYTSGLLLIYNARTGALMQRASLDPLVTGGGLKLDTQTQYLAYQTLLWSADGSRLALPFFAQSGVILPASPFASAGGVNVSIEPRPTLAGVLLLDARTLQRSSIFTAPYSATTGGAPEWNLMTGQMIQSALQLPPAVGYHWGVGGALLPDDQVSATQAPAPVEPGPVGNPAGGASFSVWQSGETASGFTQVNGVGRAVPGLDLFFAHFGVWSPDGAYLLAPTYFGGRIDTFRPPQPTTAEVASAGYAAAPLFPVRDAALASLYGAPARIDLSWSPDGQTLAAWNGGATVGSTQLGLYNAASGRLQSSLPVPAAADGQMDGSFNVTDMLRWSPDGSRLALISVSLNSLVIWQA